MTNGRDNEFQLMLDRLETLRSSRRMRDEVIRDFVTSNVESTFSGVNNHITNEAEELRQFIDEMFPHCSSEVQPTLDAKRVEIADVLEQRREVVGGALMPTTTIDLRYIGQVADRISRLVPLCQSLERIRGEVETVFRSSIQGR